MLGVIIFDRLNDVMFSHGDGQFEAHIRGMAARNGIFYPDFSDTVSNLDLASVMYACVCA